VKYYIIENIRDDVPDMAFATRQEALFMLNNDQSKTVMSEQELILAKSKSWNWS